MPENCVHYKRRGGPSKCLLKYFNTGYHVIVESEKRTLGGSNLPMGVALFPPAFSWVDREGFFFVVHMECWFLL